MVSVEIALTSVLIALAVAGDPVVEIPSGKLVGKSVEFSHEDLDVRCTVHIFQGIPYVAAPVGDLRFRRPQPRAPWDGVYNATYSRSICVQPPSPFIPVEGEQDEDCLYLNLYAPQTNLNKLPVMVWIHGGGLYMGSGADRHYDGRTLASVGDVILVTFNYRLGALGFLATGDEQISGNYGFYDQIAALQWVQDNIEAFGGDPNKVTIFGESAGSVSVEYLILSPLTDGLFHRAIMQSGTATMEGFVGIGPEFQSKIAQGLGELVGCEKGNPEELIQCLRSVPAEEFRNPSDPALGLIANITGLGTEVGPTPFPPVVDGSFMREKPVDVIREKTFTKTNLDIMMGTMADEGSMYLLLFMAHLMGEPEVSMNRSVYEIAYPLFVSGPAKYNQAALDAIRLMYVNWENADYDDADYVDAFVQGSSDEYYTCPMDLSARAHSQAGANVYLYQMTHSPANSVWRIKWMRAAHGDDLPFVFGWHFYLGGEWTMPAEEVEMSLKIMKYWTNFAKTGNPNLPSDDAELSGEDPTDEWPLFKVPGVAYKELSPMMKSKRGLKAPECALWNDFIPKLLKYTDTDTLCSVADDETEKYTKEKNQP
ncbi:acetylcholinesterase-like [Ptychodera flava]|uniref:acetylcholinesterase-like n=1 Tax=Ptychodera flava TaxID=63121 RepID=UPI00396A847D